MVRLHMLGRSTSVMLEDLSANSIERNNEDVF